MSFALTSTQINDRTKTVTRRLGWSRLRPGTLLQPVVKAQGLKKGEKVQKVGGPIRVVSVRREMAAGDHRRRRDARGVPFDDDQRFHRVLLRREPGAPVGSDHAHRIRISASSDSGAWFAMSAPADDALVRLNVAARELAYQRKAALA